MTRNFLSRFERYLVWLVVAVALLRLTIYAVAEPEEAITGITSYLSARPIIPEMGMHGTGGGSPSYKNSPTSGIISKLSAGSSTATDSSIQGQPPHLRECLLTKIDLVDGCNTLVTDCRGHSYYELHPCEGE
jgi:hypothetical protein